LDGGSTIVTSSSLSKWTTEEEDMPTEVLGANMTLWSEVDPSCRDGSLL